MENLNTSLSVDSSSQLRDNINYSNGQKIWQFLLLSVTTVGFYNIYWFYKNCKLLHQYDSNIQGSPILRAIGFCCPLVNIFLIYSLFYDIKKLSDLKGVKSYFYPGRFTLAYMVISSLWKLPDPYWLLAILMVLPLLITQQTLNRFWKKEHPELTEKPQLSGKEIIICLIGGILTFLGFFIIIFPQAVH